jgi:hypothetical protein
VTLTVGSLFAGYGGIELALASVLDLPGHAPIYAAYDAADYLVQMHREGCIDLHAHPDLSAFVREFFGGFERDGMDVADEQYAADKDES